MRIEHLRVRGLRIRVARCGEGPPVLLIMGLGGHIETWDPLRRRLHGHELIMVDHPGMGLSDTPLAPLSLCTIANLYAELLTALDHPQVDVIGYSFGGTIAQELAHRHPTRVRRLVLAATAPGWGGVPADPMTLFVASNPMRYLFPALRGAAAPFLYRGRTGRNPELLDGELGGHVNRRPSLRGVAYQIMAYSCWTSMPWLHTLSQPTLVLAGSEDPMAPLPNSRILADRIVGAQLQVVDGGGHLFLFDETATVAPWIERFLGGSIGALGGAA